MRARSAVAALALGGVFAFAGGAPADAQEAQPAEISEASHHCIELLEAGKKIDACQESPNIIRPETNEIIYGGLAFLIVLVGLRFFAYPAVKKGMDDRTERIRGDLDQADRAKSEASGVLQDYQRQLADAKNESNRIIEEARQTADQLRVDLMARAEADVAELRERSRQDIEAAKDRAMADVRSQVAALAIGAAEAVVGRNLDPEANRAIVDRFIEQVGSQA